MIEKHIFDILNTQLKLIQKQYPVENIFGIFATSIDEENKIIQSDAVIIPLFDDVCTSNKLINKTIETSIGNINLYDIRLVYQATNNGIPELIKSLDTNYIIVNPSYQHIFNKMFKCNKTIIKKGIKENMPPEELKLGIRKLCLYAWNKSSNSIRFIKQLTDTEKLALNQVIQTIGDEGTFSQNKVASAAGISRLTMTNLIMKMKFNEVAIVEYLGNQGTYVKFLDDNILDIKGDKL